MDYFSRTVVVAELYENMLSGIIDTDIMELVNSWGGLLDTISNIFYTTKGKISLEYIRKLVDAVNEITPINKNFYNYYWEIISIENNTSQRIEFLEKVYSYGNDLVAYKDWNGLLATIIETLCFSENVELDKLIKYKDELKARIN